MFCCFSKTFVDPIVIYWEEKLSEISCVDKDFIKRQENETWLSEVKSQNNQQYETGMKLQKN